jgi:hypothetical protein
MNKISLKTINNFFYSNEKLVKLYRHYHLFYNHKKEQHGGGYFIEYNNEKIKFDKVVDDDHTKLFLSTIDGNGDCILILIFKDSDIALLQSLSNDNCLKNPKLNNGKHLMAIAIKVLKKYKQKFNIKYVDLTDNSFIYCDKNVKISLADLSLLQYGDTFYGRFGFKLKEKKYNKMMINNKLILKNLLTKDINLSKIIIELKEYKLNKELLKTIYNSYQEYENELFIKWFLYISKLLMKYNCEFFDNFIIEIFQNYKLYSLAHKVFILEL